MIQATVYFPLSKRNSILFFYERNSNSLFNESPSLFSPLTDSQNLQHFPPCKKMRFDVTPDLSTTKKVYQSTPFPFSPCPKSSPYTPMGVMLSASPLKVRRALAAGYHHEPRVPELAENDFTEIAVDMNLKTNKPKPVFFAQPTAQPGYEDLPKLPSPIPCELLRRTIHRKIVNEFNDT